MTCFDTRIPSIGNIGSIGSTFSGLYDFTDRKLNQIKPMPQKDEVSCDINSMREQYGLSEATKKRGLKSQNELATAISLDDGQAVGASNE